MLVGPHGINQIICIFIIAKQYCQELQIVGFCPFNVPSQGSLFCGRNVWHNSLGRSVQSGINSRGNPQDSSLLLHLKGWSVGTGSLSGKGSGGGLCDLHGCLLCFN